MVDKLARMGVDQEDKMVSLVIPRDEIFPLLKADMAGVSFERFCSLIVFMLPHKIFINQSYLCLQFDPLAFSSYFLVTCTWPFIPNVL